MNRPWEKPCTGSKPSRRWVTTVPSAGQTRKQARILQCSSQLNTRNVGISDCNYCCKFISGGLLRRLRYNFLTIHPHAVSKRLILADTILERTFFLPMGIFLDVMCFYTCAVSHGAQSVGSMSKRDEPEKSTWVGNKFFQVGAVRMESSVYRYMCFKIILIPVTAK